MRQTILTLLTVLAGGYALWQAIRLLRLVRSGWKDFNARLIILIIFLGFFGLDLIAIRLFPKVGILEQHFETLLGIAFSGLLIQLIYHTYEELAAVYAKQKRITKGLEAALRTLQNTKLALNESAEVAITNREGKILYVNDMFCRTSGYSRGELLRQDHRIINSGRHPKEFFRDLWTTISRGRVWRGEVCNRAKDGGLHWLGTTITPFLDENNKPYQYVAVRYDITKRKEAEEALARARDTAVEAARAKAEFLANMSHEVRTPLNGTIAMASMLAETELNEEQRDYCDTIRKSGESLLGIINDILDYSKLDAQRLRFENIDFSLRELLNDTVKLLSGNARRKMLTLRSRMAVEEPARLRGDPGRIRQVLTNIVANAIKFTEKGGVTLRVTCRTLADGAQLLRFAVNDTGIGIPENAREKLFKSFTQADASTTRKFGGTGLGLAISKKLCELMGGEIGFSSAEGKGTTFWFTIRCGKARHASMPAPAPPKEAAPRRGLRAPTLPKTGGLSRRLLVVEDNPVNQKVFRSMLRKLGYEPVVVSNGEEALAALGCAEFAAVLMDCQIPEMDGYQTTAEIRRLEAGKGRIPIIAVTAHALPGDREKALAAGMDDYLAKPVRKAELEQTLRTWLGGARAKPRAANGRPMPGGFSAGPIDESVFKELAELQENGEDDVVDGIIGVFLADIPLRLEAIEKGLANDNLETVIEQAHALKGAGRTIGATKLGRLSEDLERAAKAGEPRKAARSARLLRQEYARVRGALAERANGPVTSDGSRSR